MYAVIDIGSNTMRLSIYKIQERTFKLLLHKKKMAGLAGYVDKEGNLSETGIRKAISVLKGFSNILQNIEVNEVYVFATASLRNVNNTELALERLTRESGFEVDLVSGEQEAIYGFLGATCICKLDQGILVDIGGGSTELVFYEDGKISKALSLPIGSLSLYSNYVADILPTARELAQMRELIKGELKNIKVPGNYQRICGVGGTVRASFKLYNEISNAAPTNRSLGFKEYDRLWETLTKDRAFAAQKILKTVPERIHTLIPGMTMLRMIAKKYKCEEITVSGYGVREGYLYTKLFTEGDIHDRTCRET